eukprot:CFRG7036T1
MPKQQLLDEGGPKKISKIRLGIFSGEEMERISTLRCVNFPLFEPGAGGKALPFGVLDKRLGAADKGSYCDTCGLGREDCPGHYGLVRLELPVFHVGYFRYILQILQMICKVCSRVMLDPVEKHRMLKKSRASGMDRLQRGAVYKQVHELAKKKKICPYCMAMNGTVRKIPPLNIVHIKYPPKKPTAKAGPDPAYVAFQKSFENATQSNPELLPLVKNAQDDLTPLRVLELFKAITGEDCDLIWMDSVGGRPERVVLTHLLVPPTIIRPGVPMLGGGGSTEDDLTMKLADMIRMNGFIKTKLETGDKISGIEDLWEVLQMYMAMYLDGDIPQMSAAMKKALQIDKPIRGFAQRLKGKKGRFRGNLSGKRVNFTARTVISPDPNLRIDQVAVPVLVAKGMTYPERVNRHNIDRLKRAVMNGPETHPGATHVEYTAINRRFFLKMLSPEGRKEKADSLRFGDIVERHMIDNDIVLFNRQPSLHRNSIMSHYAKVMPWRTFRFNECVCGPYNADFDGDEMNMHLPQTEEARAEALVLMGSKANMCTARNGEPLIAATQDFITASYLVSKRGLFYDRAQFIQTVSFFCDGKYRLDLPPPCVVKPVELWTGKQVFNVLLRPNKASNVIINLSTKSKTYSGIGKAMCRNDGWVVIRNSELLCGPMDKKIVGDGSKATVFYQLFREYGEEVVADRMSRLARLCARVLGLTGFSIGIEDVTPSHALSTAVSNMCDNGSMECDKFISDFEENKLKLLPGCSPEESLEAEVSRVLNLLREKAGKLCLAGLMRYNAPMAMTNCGSKGSENNIAQMIACVGNQMVNGARIPDGFESRSLPHFERFSKTPQAKGFVRNSFYTGLEPTEFFFHAMAGREGLVDTAVKTANTGYMQRRVTKAMEDLVIHYDATVRTCNGQVIQFTYGDDGLDPLQMEDDDGPVVFDSVLLNTQAMYPSLTEESLSPKDIMALVDEKLYVPDDHKDTSEGEEVVRGQIGLSNAKQYPFSQCLTKFRNEIRLFFSNEVNAIQKIRRSVGLPPSDNNSLSLDQRILLDAVNSIKRLSSTQIDRFMHTCVKKYAEARQQPATPVGALAAQSIGEPATQMTLKTFHFAGVASMNVTLGVPRMEEIINATKNTSTPIIEAPLTSPLDERHARLVKGMIEETRLGQIAQYVQEVFREKECYISIKLDLERIRLLKLNLTVYDIEDALMSKHAMKLKIKLNSALITTFEKEGVVRVYPPIMLTKNKRAKSVFHVIQFLKRELPNVIVCGIPTIGRAVINKAEKDFSINGYNLLVEGNELATVLATPGVDSKKAVSNHVMEMEKTLGIEAARQTIIVQIDNVMSSYGIKVDTRHLMLLADLMSYKGEILGIQRHGISKMKDSTFALASFERTCDNLFEGSVHSQTDKITGPSECIMMGIPISLGTGLFKMLRDPVKRKAGISTRDSHLRTFTPKRVLFDNPDLHVPV